jgi:hypothetical protein
MYTINKGLWRWANLHNNDDGATSMSFETSRTLLPLLRSQWNIESVASRMINRLKPSSFSPHSILFSLHLSHSTAAIGYIVWRTSSPFHDRYDISKEQRGVGTTLCYTVRFSVDIIRSLSAPSPVMAQHNTTQHTYLYIQLQDLSLMPSRKWLARPFVYFKQYTRAM